jgi:hypothetical protein
MSYTNNNPKLNNSRGNLFTDSITANPGRRTTYNAGHKHKNNIQF